MDQGRIVLVTGGAGKLARNIAQGFVENGDTVVLFDIDAHGLEAGALALQEHAGRACVVTRLVDIVDEASVDAGVRSVIEECGRIDVLCNNAGVMDGFAPVHQADLATWNRCVGLNMTAPFLMSRAVLPGMMERGKGVILARG
jgi:3-oxoacyl-[acyl-carrier protein] reductase